MASDATAAAPRISFTGSSLDAAAEAAANVRAKEEAAQATTDSAAAQGVAEPGTEQPAPTPEAPVEGKEGETPEQAGRFSEYALETAALWGKTAGLPDCAVIWLHGQGQTEVYWQETFRDIRGLGGTVGECRWIWPRANVIPCTAFGGYPTLQWFDVPELPVSRVVRGVPDRPRRQEDPNEIEAAVHRIHEVIAALEVEGVPAERIAVGGFDQGAALAAHVLLRHPEKLAGGVMLGGWLPCIEQLKAATTTAGLSADLLWYHGASDAVVHPDVAAMQVQELEALGVNVDFNIALDLGHGTNDNMLQDLKRWLSAHLPGPLPEAEPDVEQTSSHGQASVEGAVKPTEAETTAAAGEDPSAGRRGSRETASLSTSRRGSRETVPAGRRSVERV